MRMLMEEKGMNPFSLIDWRISLQSISPKYVKM